MCLAVFENLHLKEVSCKKERNNLQASTRLGTGSLCPEFWAAMDFVCYEKESIALRFQQEPVNLASESSSSPSMTVSGVPRLHLEHSV